MYLQGVHCMMCTCKMVVERVSIEAFFYHIGRRRVNWGLLYRHLPPWRKGYVCTLFLNHLTFSKVKSWWPRVSWLFLCVHVNKLLWIYYVQTIFLKSAYLKYHSSKASNTIYEHCKQKHTNNETQFGKHSRSSKSTLDHQRPSN